MAKAERLGYLIAVLILVILGATLRSPILNWIVGPGIVVSSVSIPVMIDRRSSNKKAQQ